MQEPIDRIKDLVGHLVQMAHRLERERCACILRKHAEFWHNHAFDIPSAAELAAECENILTEITGKQP